MFKPLVLICELTHRCPLRCAYCSNPRSATGKSAELDTESWRRVIEEAAELGVLQVHLSGGEPLLRGDLAMIAAAAGSAGLYPTLISSGLGAGSASACLRRLDEVVSAGVRAVQVSVQDTNPAAAAAIAGRDALARKLEFARRVRALGASLTTNFVLHRENLARLPEFIELSLELGADRVELAHTQYYGWAELNQVALAPTRAQVDIADQVVAEAKRRHTAEIEILYIKADIYADRAKACMGGWGRRAIVVDPEGTVLPCHGARSLALTHEIVGDRSLATIWAEGSAFQAFRGESWMEEPCRSCPQRGHDFGGCRCQALALTGRATAADPACDQAPEHSRIVAIRRRAEQRPRRHPLLLRTLARSAGSNGDQ